MQYSYIQQSSEGVQSNEMRTQGLNQHHIENYREAEKTKILTSDSRKLSSGQNWNSNRARTAATPTRHTTDNNPKENTNRKTVTTHPPYNYELIQRESWLKPEIPAKVVIEVSNPPLTPQFITTIPFGTPSRGGPNLGTSDFHRPTR